jgi:5-methylcytosine-specific restriction endonuclease McrA
MTKKQFKDILYNLPLGKVENDFVFREIFKKHPEYLDKLGSGIQNVFVRINKLNKKAREVYIERTDGTVVDISWLKCLSGKATPYHELLLSAMREAISRQVKTYLKNNPICSECGSTENLEADHVNPSFKELTSRFEIPTQEFLDGAFNRATFKDLSVKERWQDFHQHYANLQTLCSDCHKNKTHGMQNTK